MSILYPLKNCGGIKDVGLGLRWDAEALSKEVIRRAAVLAQMGIKPGSVVAIGHGGTAHFFADLFACWHIGAAAACLDSSLTPSELKNVVGFAKPAAFLTSGNSVVGDIQVPVVNLGAQQWDTSSPPTPVIAGDAALILFTSETTGTPKGVVLSFGALQARIISQIEDAVGAVKNTAFSLKELKAIDSILI